MSDRFDERISGLDVVVGGLLERLSCIEERLCAPTPLYIADEKTNNRIAVLERLVMAVQAMLLQRIRDLEKATSSTSPQLINPGCDNCGKPMILSWSSNHWICGNCGQGLAEGPDVKDSIARPGSGSGWIDVSTSPADGVDCFVEIGGVVKISQYHTPKEPFLLLQFGPGFLDLSTSIIVGSHRSYIFHDGVTHYMPITLPEPPEPES